MGPETRETEALEPGEPIRVAAGSVLNGRYRLDRELGRGGMGIVFQATDLELLRDVAVKVLPEAVASPDAGERLLREARAAAALNHPHIVAVHDVGAHRGMPYFVMELVEGGSLHTFRPADLGQIVQVAVQICAALEHAHAHDLIHRDIKPENVLLPSGRVAPMVKLADLGLAVFARSSRRITEAGSIAGTAAYMAPEQALGQPVDGRADLYALGCVLYELMTGRPPFVGTHPLEIVSQHVHAPVVPPRVLRPDLPVPLDAVILRLLAKNPAQRYASAREARLALEVVLSGGPAPDTGGIPATIALLDALSRGRLVARASELTEIRELWRRARDGAGHCALISGEPGAGKTRLAREALLHATLDGGAVLQGACYENEATTPYLPFVEAFRRFVREQKDDTALRAIVGDAAAQIAKLAPEIRTRLGAGAERPPLAPHEERLLFFDAVTQVFRELAARRGLLFYIDDLHWADSSTLWLLGHLLRNLREDPVLVLASYRDTEVDRAHPLARALDDWNRERLTTRIRVRRLEGGETREQLEALLGEPVSEEFSGAVHRETEGNPFFVEEVLKSLIEQGSVRRESGKWKRADVADIAIPQSMKAAIGRRLDRVKHDCNEVLRAAAVLGKTFTFQELLALNDSRDEERLLDALDEAVAAQLVVAGPGESFAFTHDKIREVLYEELNPIRRRRFHRKAAEGLDRLRASRAVAVEKLAHHYIEAGDHQRGLEFANRAAAEAEQIFAYDEAIAAYGRALECAEALGRDDERVVLEEAMGKASLNAGNTIPAAQHFERAMALARDPHARARLQCLAADSLVTNGDPRGLEYVREALAVLDPATHPIETAKAFAIEARFHHLAGRHRDAATRLETALELAALPRDGNKPTGLHLHTLSLIYAYGSGAYQHLGLFENADRWARQAIAFGEEHGTPLAQAIGYEFLGENAASTGRYAEGLEYAEREREIIARLHSRERLSWTGWVAGTCAMLLGDAQRAEREYVDAIALATAIGERRLLPFLIAFYSAFLADRGRVNEAEQAALSAFEKAEATGLFFLQAEAQRALARVRFDQGKLDDAIRHCETALAIMADKDAKVTRLWLGPLHVTALLAAGRRAEAVDRFEEYAAMVAECQTPRFSAEVTRLRGLLRVA